MCMTCVLSVLPAQGGGLIVIVQLGCDSPCGISYFGPSYSHVTVVLLFSMHISLVMFPLSGDLSLENFSFRESNIPAVFRG